MDRVRKLTTALLVAALRVSLAPAAWAAQNAEFHVARLSVLISGGVKEPTYSVLV
jgi:hypothetical protein